MGDCRETLLSLSRQTSILETVGARQSELESERRFRSAMPQSTLRFLITSFMLNPCCLVDLNDPVTDCLTDIGPHFEFQKAPIGRLLMSVYLMALHASSLHDLPKFLLLSPNFFCIDFESRDSEDVTTTAGMDSWPNLLRGFRRLV